MAFREPPESTGDPIATLERQVERTAQTAFPLRVAALDVGSNAIRYLAAEFSSLDHHVELEGQRFGVRLGHDAFTTGVLGQATMDATVSAAVQFRQRLDDLGITHYRAVATSALRESRNGGELVDRIRRESGVHLETITGSEEARLVWLAVARRVSIERRPWILVDLGGGSLEISVISQEGLLGSESHPMGTVRLLENLSEVGQEADDFRNLVERYAARLSLPAGTERDFEGLIITGGNAEALGDLAGTARIPGEVSELTRADLRKLLDRLANMTVAQRIAQLGLREDRADVIVPAAILFDRIAGLAKRDRIVVPRVGVKEGVLYDLVADRAEHGRHESDLDRAAYVAALALGRRYRFDEEHSRHVSQLALSLFDQLGALHKLDEGSRRLLATASLLHDIGQFISFRKHHRHTWYLLAHSELPGLSPLEMRLIALAARYHRGAEPKDYHDGYAELREPERETVHKLAALLRVAAALDREHRRRVHGVTATMEGKKVFLAVDATEDALLEQWALTKAAPVFERVFGVRLVPITTRQRNEGT